MKKFLLSLLGLITCICAQATDYKLVTSASDLEVGANYIIVGGSYYTLSAKAATNNFPQQAITAPTDNVITIGDESITVITLENSSDSSYPYKFKVSTGYLYAAGDPTATKNQNYLKVTSSPSTTANASITISSNIATIKFNNSKFNILRYNSSSKIFSCYSSGQNDVYLYKEVTTPGGGEGTKAEAGLAYTPTEDTLVEGEKLTQPTFDNPNKLTVTFTTSNDAVATVNATTGEITLAGGLGTAVITATSEETETYKAGSATFTITVKKAQVAYLVTDVSVLQPGDIIIFASQEDAVAFATKKSNNNNGAKFTSSITLSNYNTEIVSISDEVMLFEVGNDVSSEATYYTFKTTNYLGTNGYIGNSGTSNGCYVDATISARNRAKVSIDAKTGLATIIFNEGSTTGNTYLKYNSSSPGYFNCYASDKQNLVSIYKVTNKPATVSSEVSEASFGAKVNVNGNNVVEMETMFVTSTSFNKVAIYMENVLVGTYDVNSTNGEVDATFDHVPYLPTAKFTMRPVLATDSEGNPTQVGPAEPLNFTWAELPVLDFTSKKMELFFDSEACKVATTCSLDAWVFLTVDMKDATTKEYLGEADPRRNLTFSFEEFGNSVPGVEIYGWYTPYKEVQWCKYKYFTDVPVENELPVTADVIHDQVISLSFNAYFTFNVTPELASLLPSATRMEAPARAGEAEVIQTVAQTAPLKFMGKWPESLDSVVSGVEGVTVDGGAAVEYFNLQGVRVDGDLAPGIYIRRQGQAVSKVQIR